MSETHPHFGTRTSPAPLAVPARSSLSTDPPVAAQATADKSKTFPPLIDSPITAAFRDYTPSRLTPASIDEQPPVRQSSRLKHETVYDLNAPVVLHEHIEEGGMAVDEVLTLFGFVLCDDDTMWL
jgi:hypothetical protein